MINPYKIHLSSFFETIIDFNHTANRYNKVILEDVKKYTAEGATYFSGSRLIIGDWTGPSDNGWKITFNTGIKKSVFKENYASEIENVLSREFGLAFCQCYEAFETLLKDFVYLKIQNDQKFKENLKKEFTRENLRGGEEIFKLIKKASGNRFKKYSKSTNNNFKFSQLFRILSEVRHAITHSKGRLETLKVKKDNYYIELFEHLFPLNKLENEYVQIKFDYKILYKLLICLSEFGYQIFKILSEEDKYDWKL